MGMILENRPSGSGILQTSSTFVGKVDVPEDGIHNLFLFSYRRLVNSYHMESPLTFSSTTYQFFA